MLLLLYLKILFRKIHREKAEVKPYSLWKEAIVVARGKVQELRFES